MQIAHTRSPLAYAAQRNTNGARTHGAPYAVARWLRFLGPANGNTTHLVVARRLQRPLRRSTRNERGSIQRSSLRVTIGGRQYSEPFERCESSLHALERIRPLHFCVCSLFYVWGGVPHRKKPASRSHPQLRAARQEQRHTHHWLTTAAVRSAPPWLGPPTTRPVGAAVTGGLEWRGSWPSEARSVYFRCTGDGLLT